MTASADDYVALITSEHRQAKFLAMVTATAQPFVDGTNLLDAMRAGTFDLDLAVGQQLDFVGQWVGLGRGLAVPIAGVYFSFDTDGVGFDQGVWQGPNDPNEGLVQLDDDTYRMALRVKIASNVWDGTLEQAESILAEIFAGTGTNVFIQDEMNMAITIGITGAAPSAVLLALFQQGLFFVRGAGVLIDGVTVLTPGPFFGFDVENFNVSGFDVGYWDGTQTSSFDPPRDDEDAELFVDDLVGDFGADAMI